MRLRLRAGSCQQAEDRRQKGLPAPAEVRRRRVPVWNVGGQVLRQELMMMMMESFFVNRSCS